MSPSSLLAILAGSWGVLMSLSPLLQVRAIVRARTSVGISLSYLMVLQVGFLLWLSYGIAIRNTALIATNAVALLTYTATVFAVRVYRRVPHPPESPVETLRARAAAYGRAMSSGLRIGVQLPEVERLVGWAEYLTMATAAEEVGFDSVWVGDHLLYRDDGREERGPWDAWSILAALAASTTRVDLGPLVACTAFSSAAQIARRAAAIQEISGGRFVLGLGAGWNEAEFRAFGIPTDRRAARFAGAFEIISHLLDGDRVSALGPFDHLDDAVLLPRPARPPRIMVGSTGERVLRASLPRADAWNIWFEWYGNDPEGFKEANDRITSLLTDLGRDPSDVARTATVFVALEGGASDRPHVAGSPPLMGSPDDIAAQLAEFQKAGLEEAILVVSPITEVTIRALGAVIGLLRG